MDSTASGGRSLAWWLMRREAFHTKRNSGRAACSRQRATTSLFGIR
jgi:hypothetical protein